jgi:two-component system response regulator DctR
MMVSEQVVYLVDDEPAVRDALSFLLESRGLRVSVHADGRSLLDLLAGAAAPSPVRGCFVLDVRVPGMSGLELFECLLARAARNPILFLTGHGDVQMAVEALKRGAFDFIEKPYADNALVERIVTALAVEAAGFSRNARVAERDARVASLTAREREVMQRVVAGKMNKVIADELTIAVRTVEVTRARVFAKLGVRSAVELATLLAAR